MAITHAAYGRFMQEVFNGVYDVTNDTTKVALLTSSYTPDLNAHIFLSDVNANEVTGSGYTAGGQTLSIDGSGYDSGTTTVTAEDLTWPNLTAVFRYAVIYQVKSTAATSNLMGLVDFGSDRSYNAAPFTLSAPNGLFILNRAS